MSSNEGVLPISANSIPCYGEVTLVCQKCGFKVEKYFNTTFTYPFISDEGLLCYVCIMNFLKNNAQIPILK